MNQRSILLILSFFLPHFFTGALCANGHVGNNVIVRDNKSINFLTDKDIGVFKKTFYFCVGLKNAFCDNVANIFRSLLYPIESMIRIYNFCKKVLKCLFAFIIYPQPDEVYLKMLDTFFKKISNYFAKMPADQKYKWFGYVSMDFIIGFVAPAGLGWKAIFLTKNAIISIKGIKYIDLLNRVTAIDSNVIRIVDSSSRASLLNMKYSFEYADQFRQYLHDIIRRESY